MGIDIVVDTRGNSRQKRGKEVRRDGMQYVSIPWHCPFHTSDVFAKFSKLLRKIRARKCFVALPIGNDRTGMMVAGYRIG